MNMDVIRALASNLSLVACGMILGGVLAMFCPHMHHSCPIAQKPAVVDPAPPAAKSPQAMHKVKKHGG
jgi:hypothetical protein